MLIFEELRRRNVLRVAAAYVAVSWLIVQIMDTLSDAFSLTGDHIRTVVIVLAVCFIPIMIISWVFEWTPDGFRREVDVERDSPVAKRPAKRLDRFVMVALAVAVAYFVIDELLIEPRQGPQIIEDRSIAVLPFVNMSSDPEQEYFSDGISEELLNLLARIPELRVVSRSSSFRFKGQDLDIPEVAEQLGVTWILEGSVRKAGNILRITAQLIDGQRDEHVWSETWDREHGDIFAIQDEIAAEVVDRMQVTLLTDMPRVPRGDPRAHELTTMARMIERLGDGTQQERRQRARTMVERALDIDPNYIPAIIYRANLDYWDHLERERLDQVEYEVMLGQWRRAAERALELDPTHPHALLAAGWIKYELERDLPAAARLFERAIAAAPSDDEILRVTSAFARQVGQFDASIKLAERWGAVSPFCSVCDQPWREGFRLYLAGRFDEALDTFEDVRPDSGFPYTTAVFTRASIFLLRGTPEQALAELDGDYERFEGLTHEAEHLRAIALWNLGRHEEALAIREAHRQEPEWQVRIYVAREYAWMGELDQAFAILRDLFWPSMYRFRNYVQQPLWKPLQDDPRWRELLERSGMTPEALAAVEFDPQFPD